YLPTEIVLISRITSKGGECYFIKTFNERIKMDQYVYMNMCLCNLCVNTRVCVCVCVCVCTRGCYLDSSTHSGISSALGEHRGERGEGLRLRGGERDRGGERG